LEPRDDVAWDGFAVRILAHAGFHRMREHGLYGHDIASGRSTVADPDARVGWLGGHVVLRLTVAAADRYGDGLALAQNLTVAHPGKGDHGLGFGQPDAGGNIGHSHPR